MSFVLCEDGTESHHKVLLGSQPTCSCRYVLMTLGNSVQVLCELVQNPNSACRKGKGREVCLHHIFVMLRILRLSASNPLIWQLALIGKQTIVRNLPPLLLDHVFTVTSCKAEPPIMSSHSSTADRELDEALWQSGTHQILAPQIDHKPGAQAASASVPVNRRPLEQVCIKCNAMCMLGDAACQVRN